MPEASSGRAIPARLPRKVFITGASGFIGRALAERYRELGCEVRGVDIRADPSMGVVAGDLAGDAAWQSHASGSDLVIHTAAIVSFRRGADPVWRVNVLGTRRALDAAVRCGAQRFVHFSSVTVFSFDFPDDVDERYPVRCNGVPYVDSKVTSEAVVLAAHAAAEVACTVIRPGDVYGPRSRPWVVIPIEMMRRRQFVLPAGGRGIFSHVYVDNLVDGTVLAAGSAQGSGQVFTITDGARTTTADYFGRLSRAAGLDRVRAIPTTAAVAIGAVGERAMRLMGRDTEFSPASVRYLARGGGYSIAKARSMLSYAPLVGLDEGMTRVSAWLKQAGIV